MINTILLCIGFFFASICSAISFRLLFIKHISIHLKLFPIYLFVSLIFLIIGYKVQYEIGTNHFVFNYHNIINFIFYLFFFWKILGNGFFRRIAFYAILLFPIVAAINMLYLQGVEHYNTFTHSLGAVLIVLFSIEALYELFTKTPTKVSPTNLPEFWICMGLLVYYGVTFVGFNAIQAGISHSEAALQIISIILMLSQYFLCVNFSIGFFCALNQQPAREPVPPTTSETEADDFSF